MELKEFVREGLEQARGGLERALGDLSDDELAWRSGPEVNSIAFITWHVTRVEDRWLQRFAQGVPEVWLRDGWSERLGLPEGDTGIQYGVEELAGFPPIGGGDLRGYSSTVQDETLSFLEGLDPADFDHAPDRQPFPELAGAVRFFEGYTIGKMFRQLLAEKGQHVGHVAFVRGLQRGLNK